MYVDREYEYKMGMDVNIKADLDWGPSQDPNKVTFKLRLEEFNPGGGNCMRKDP